MYLPNRPDLFVKGKAKNKLFGTKAFKSRCLALQVDFSKNVCIASVVFFALLRWAVVQFAILMRSVGGMLILLLNHVGGGDCYCAPLPPPHPTRSTIAGTIVN